MSLTYATKGWISLGVHILAIELAAPDGQLLSEGVDRALEKPLSRAIAYAVIVSTAAHLLNLIRPNTYDPYHQLFEITRKVTRVHGRNWWENSFRPNTDWVTEKESI